LKGQGCFGCNSVTLHYRHLGLPGVLDIICPLLDHNRKGSSLLVFKFLVMDSSKDQKKQDVLSAEDGDSEQEENVAEEQKQENNKDVSSPGKIFIGGLSRSTSSSVFTKHFSKYGEITDSVIMKDRLTGQPRGFGFVTYADPSVLDKVIHDKHVLDGKTVEIKRTIPRENSTKGPKTRKVFVGGIPTSITEDEFKDYFSKFGKVVEHQIMQDRSTGRSRGFGFITFDSEQAVEEIMSKGKMLELGGKQVEIKKAEPKKPLPDAGPMHAIDSRPPFMTGGVGGFGDSYSGVAGAGYGSNPYRSAGSGVGGAGYGSNPYRSAGGYGDRPGGYAGYGGPDYGRGYGGYSGGSLGGYTEDASRGYGGRAGSYSEGVGGYDSGTLGGYGGADGYGAYGDSVYGGRYESRVGGPYGSGGAYGSGRGAYGGSSLGRYHPYAR